MLYTMYLPKRKGEISENIKGALTLYSEISLGTNDIICSPGYMSTSKDNAYAFFRELGNIISPNEEMKKIGLFTGMNGNRTYEPGVTLREMHENVISKHSADQDFYFSSLMVDANTVTDHRKIIVFFKQNCDPDKYNGLNRSRMNEFLDDVAVNAVLIGSSNQSFSTYFNIANKGEADVFIMLASDCGISDPDSIRGFIENIGMVYNNQNIAIELEQKYDTFLRSVAISKTLSDNDFSDEFLKDILRDLLDMGLN